MVMVLVVVMLVCVFAWVYDCNNIGVCGWVNADGVGRGDAGMCVCVGV